MIKNKTYYAYCHSYTTQQTMTTTMMRLNIVIVESGAKCKKIESYLGSGYKCIPTFGHLCEIKSLDQLAIHEHSIVPSFSCIQTDIKRKQRKLIKTAIQQAGRVILATDNDREGESIAWHICRLYKLPIETTERIIFNDLSRDSVQYAIQHPRRIRMNVVQSQISRQIIDLLIGFIISPVVWARFPKNTNLSAGRCQTPALRFVYDSHIKQEARKKKVVLQYSLVLGDAAPQKPPAPCGERLESGVGGLGGVGGKRERVMAQGGVGGRKGGEMGAQGGGLVGVGGQNGDGWAQQVEKWKKIKVGDNQPHSDVGRYWVAVLPIYNDQDVDYPDPQHQPNCPEPSSLSPFPSSPHPSPQHRPNCPEPPSLSPSQPSPHCDPQHRSNCPEPPSPSSSPPSSPQHPHSHIAPRRGRGAFGGPCPPNFMAACPADILNPIVCDPPTQHVSNPPMPFTTSSLLQRANQSLSLSAKQTMDYCQQLYEAGLITYLRTDSSAYNCDFVDTVTRYITELFGEQYISSCIPTQLVTDDCAHEAIRVTNLHHHANQVAIDMESTTIGRLYGIIYNNTIESCMAPAIEKRIHASIRSTSFKDIVFRQSAHYEVFDGWKRVSNKKQLVEQKNAHYLFLESVNGCKLASYSKIETRVQLADMHSPLLTESSLIHALKENGIGRPSTFSTIIETLYKRKYIVCEDVKAKPFDVTLWSISGKPNSQICETIETKWLGEEKNKLIIQPLGIQVSEFLQSEYNDLFNYEYSNQMETRLDNIATGVENMDSICSQYYQQIYNGGERTGHNDDNAKMTHLTKINSTVIDDYLPFAIDSKHSLIRGKYGLVIKYYNRGSKKPLFKPISKKITIHLDMLLSNQYTIETLVGT